MQRTSVIVSGTASLPEPTLRDLRRHSSTTRRTRLWSDLWEIWVAKINILRSKSGAFTTSWIALIAVRTDEGVYSLIGWKGPTFVFWSYSRRVNRASIRSADTKDIGTNLAEWLWERWHRVWRPHLVGNDESPPKPGHILVFQYNTKQPCGNIWPRWMHLWLGRAYGSLRYTIRLLPPISSLCIVFHRTAIGAKNECEKHFQIR